MRLLSSTVRFRFPAAALPQGVSEFAWATPLFSEFGEIARLDVSHLTHEGSVTVTYHDSRAAEAAFQRLSPVGSPSSLPPAQGDFHTVIVDPSALLDEHALDEFLSIGEVANAYNHGAELCIEFFDMRCARAAVSGTPSCRPSMPVALNTKLDAAKREAAALSAKADLVAALTTQVNCQHAATKMALAMASPPQPPQRQALQAQGPQKLLLGLILGQEGCKESAVAEATAFDFANATPGVEGFPDVADYNEQECYVEPPTVVAEPTKGSPAHEKTPVQPENFASFSVNPQGIIAGEEKRTTVMLRSLRKSCTHDVLEQLLAQCGLTGRYTFLYMPFDRRDASSSGFAFVDLATAQDVLQLSFALEMLRRDGGPGANKAVPVLTYARLQGFDQLLSHFGRSAVMHDPNPARRPRFYRACAKAAEKANRKKQAAAGPPVSTPVPSPTPAAKKPSPPPGLTAGMDDPLYIRMPQYEDEKVWDGIDFNFDQSSAICGA